MSIAAVKWAFRQEGLTPVEKLVLVYIAEAERDGTCYPGRERIAAACGVNLSSVSKAIKRFQCEGLISVEKDGRRNHYRVHTEGQTGGERQPVKGGERQPIEPEQVASGNHIGGERQHIQVASRNMTIKKNRKNEPEGNRKNNVGADAFEEFWKAYPHPPNRGSKKVAREKWGRVKDPPAVFHGVANYAAYLASSDWQQPAMAQTWLHQERWEEWQEARFDDRNRTVSRAKTSTARSNLYAGMAAVFGGRERGDDSAESAPGECPGGSGSTDFSAAGVAEADTAQGARHGTDPPFHALPRPGNGRGGA